MVKTPFSHGFCHDFSMVTPHLAASPTSRRRMVLDLMEISELITVACGFGAPARPVGEENSNFTTVMAMAISYKWLLNNGITNIL